MTGRTGAVARFADAATRWVPDAFSIAALLTLVSLGLGVTLGGASPTECLTAWGDGFWSLLEFSMQIAVVIFAGYMAAVSPLLRRAIDWVASRPRSPREAVAVTALVSLTLCWLNWGLGLIVAAILVRAVAERQPEADYRLLVTAAYLGLGATWHAGPSGSVPLLLAMPDSFMIDDGLLAQPIPLARTVLAPANLWLMLLVTAALTTLMVILQPTGGGNAARAVAPRIDFQPPVIEDQPTPADRLRHSPWLNRPIGGLGFGYLALRATSGDLALTLDTVNLAALSLAMLLHPSSASLVAAAEDAARALHGVVLQFPLYAGIYGIIKGTALAGVVAAFFVQLASTATYPLVLFWYSAFLNYFVPSGGGQWAIQASYMIEAARALEVSTERVAMAYAYGEMSTNLIQPFWAIPPARCCRPALPRHRGVHRDSLRLLRHADERVPVAMRVRDLSAPGVARPASCRTRA